MQTVELGSAGETGFEVCRSIGRYREEGSLWGWVRTIAASKALMRLRRNKYRDTDELQEDVVGHRREDTALRMDLEAALERLSETSRAVVWLHDVEGYTHEEIAGMMGRTPSFSKSQLARAHQRLRRWLGEEVEV
jgi:RNA polymerase sigma-70 factor (ECF subfamily)